MTESQVVSPTKPEIVFPFLANKKIPLNTLLSIDIGEQKTAVITNEETKVAIAAVATGVFNGTLSYDEFEKRTAYIYDKMDWDLINKQGKFLVRLDNFMFKTYKVNLNDYVRKEINAILDTEFPPPKKYYFDIDVSLKWLRGEFGDYQSCFFNSDEPGSEFGLMRAREGFFSLRFFKPYDLSSFPEQTMEYMKAHFPSSYYIDGTTIYRGYARNWMRYGEGVEYPVVFNSYGHSSSTASRILATYLDAEKMTTHNVSIFNTGMYNNGDGQIIRPKDVMLKSRSINCNSTTKRVTFEDRVESSANVELDDLEDHCFDEDDDWEDN